MTLDHWRYLENLDVISKKERVCDCAWMISWMKCFIQKRAQDMPGHYSFLLLSSDMVYDNFSCKRKTVF